jgi:hypothetical protein
MCKLIFPLQLEFQGQIFKQAFVCIKWVIAHTNGQVHMQLSILHMKLYASESVTHVHKIW